MGLAVGARLLTTTTFIAVATMFPFLAPTPPAVARLFETQSPPHIVFGLASAILEHPWLTARWVIAMQSCLFIVYNIGFHYYMAVHEPPGSVTNGLSDDLGERRIGPGSEVWWARHRSRAGKESILASRCENRYPLLRRVSESKRQISEEEVQRVQDSEDLWVNVKMCHKCPRIPLWKALACLPPELRLVEKQIRQSKQEAGSGGAGQVVNGGSLAPSLVHAQSDFVDQAARGDTVEEIQAWLGSEANNLVPPPKPERTHHCSVCEVCILKFDHHCPWLNQCVGVGNERYFVLFMVWLSLGCFVVIFSGWRTVAKSVSFATWPYRYTPRIFPLLTYALCAIMGFALAIMAIWQILIIGWGETSVENSDNGEWARRCPPFTYIPDTLIYPPRPLPRGLSAKGRRVHQRIRHWFCSKHFSVFQRGHLLKTLVLDPLGTLADGAVFGRMAFQQNDWSSWQALWPRSRRRADRR